MVVVVGTVIGVVVAVRVGSYRTLKPVDLDSTVVGFTDELTVFLSFVVVVVVVVVVVEVGEDDDAAKRLPKVKGFIDSLDELLPKPKRFRLLSVSGTSTVVDVVVAGFVSTGPTTPVNVRLSLSLSFVVSVVRGLFSKGYFLFSALLLLLPGARKDQKVNSFVCPWTTVVVEGENFVLLLLPVVRETSKRW